MPLDAVSMNLAECLVCGRFFEESRICHHQEICKKSVKGKRKPFDSFKQRITGTVMEKYATNIKSRLESQRKMNHGNWREAHKEFINIIKAAKNTAAGLTVNERLNPCAPTAGKAAMPPL